MAPEIINVGPSATSSKSVRIGAHRVAIANVACKLFGIELHELQRQPKSLLPWQTYASLIAYVLRRDTNAQDTEIAAIIACPTRFVAAMIEAADNKLGQSDDTTIKYLGDIRDGVHDAIGDDGIVWHRKLAEKKNLPINGRRMDPRLVEIMDVIAAKIEGVSIEDIRSSRKTPEIVRARYIAIAIFAYRNTHMRIDQIATIFNKSIATIEKATLDIRNALETEGSELARTVRTLLPKFGITDEAEFKKLTRF